MRVVYWEFSHDGLNNGSTKHSARDAFGFNGKQ